MSDIFSEIPYEIVVKILSFLPAKDLCSISLVNKNLLSFTQDDYIWQSICINQFPASRISEEQNMISEEATSKIQETDNLGNQSGTNFIETIVSNLAKLVLSTPSVESNSNEKQVTVSEHSEWKRLYKRLSRHINFIAKERGVIWLDCQQGGGDNHHWRTIEDSQSEFGKVVYLDYVWWFDVSSTLKAVLPGTYDVVWRLKIEQIVYTAFNIQLNIYLINKKFEDEGDAETAIHDEQKHNHIPQPTLYANITRKSEWVEYCLPYKIDVPERKIVDGKMVYHDIHLKIYNHDSTSKSGLWIDYVRLREHDKNRVYEQFEEIEENEPNSTRDDDNYDSDYDTDNDDGMT
ncbi:4331_t:CDS:2 [Gigaspora margarita]|uniref:4331_t:CDS:1 n=1 Tax=Gigaspora margarita TaxID=4874 RepID=A0ABN7V6Y6_GIGMA|nr:4331_t:CDS:2 [Gigaspora margarita]